MQHTSIADDLVERRESYANNSMCPTLTNVC